MANPRDETITYPFTAFNFAVEITLPGSPDKVCSAAFSDCDGLEMTMDVKTIRQGGDNARQIRLTGPLAFGVLTLKRGMTRSFDLWDWMARMQTEPGLRANARVRLLAPDGRTERATFVLARCVPTKLKGPAMNAKEGGVAVEEFQLAYESLTLARPTGG